MDKARKPRMEIMQMIERVRDGEDAEEVIAGRKPGKEKNGDPDGLDERLERFLGDFRRMR